ncbi:MAG: YihY family inner membrane protein [Phycisphaerales bacterium]|nr:YihY family inner membrane protein [Phycisphaerales bacterium]
MKFLGHFKLHIERLLTAPGEEMGHWSRFARFQIQLWRFCARRLWENNVAAMSAALSFRTIFAMIPAIVLAVLVLKSVGVLDDGKKSLREFLAGAGVTRIAIVDEEFEAAPSPDSESEKVFNVADEIESIVDDVEAKLTIGRIGPVGVALLIWTALTLLTTVERSLNRIFGASRQRPIARRVLLYWSVLTLGPLVLIVVEYASRRVTQLVENMPGLSWLLGISAWAAPIVVGVLVLGAVYKHMPNTHVQFRSAIGGAAVAVPLWLLAKWGFAIYVAKLVGTGNLYGALGLLPLFMIWLNLSWLIFLFGAELAHTAVNLTDLEIAEKTMDSEPGPSDLLAAAVAVAQPFIAGRGPVSADDIAKRLSLTSATAQRLLDRLESSMIVCAVESDRSAAYVLSRPAEKIAILDIAGMNGRLEGNSVMTLYAPDIKQAVEKAWSHARSAVGDYTLADVVRERAKS